MAKPVTSNGYSADVRMTLLIDGQQLPVAQAGGDRIVLRQPASLPSPDAELVISIDGQEDRWRVALSPSEEPKRAYAARFTGSHVRIVPSSGSECNLS